MSVSWCVSCVAALPVAYLVCWIPWYRVVRSHRYFHVSAHANYISAIIWRSHEGWQPASTGETTNWMIATSEPQVAFASWLLQHQLNTTLSFQELCPAPCSSFYSAPTVLYFFFFLYLLPACCDSDPCTTWYWLILVAMIQGFKRILLLCSL